MQVTLIFKNLQKQEEVLPLAISEAKTPAMSQELARAPPTENCPHSSMPNFVQALTYL